jgi:beta-glucanase (GH16 family)
MKKIIYTALFFAFILRGGMAAQKTTATILVDTSTLLNPLQKDGWTLLWHDEFDVDTIDPHVWWPQTTETPNTLTYFTPRPENVNIKNGCLHIVNQKENYKGYPFTGGNVYSARKIEINSRVEASMKIPKGKSLWPCFWLLGNGGVDSVYQEVDIAEFRCSKPNEVDISNHFGNPKYKVGTEWRRISTKKRRINIGKKKLDLSEDFHLYAVEWTTESLRFFIDNLEVYELRQNIPRFPMHLILSMGVGGADGNPEKQTTFPADFTFDYVRIYKK